MAGLALSINGRLATGETLQVWSLGSPTSLQWQALVNGVWTNVGTANSQTYVIPASGSGLSYRVVGTSADGTFFSAATASAITDSKRASAPVLSGPAYSLIGTEDPGQRSVFSWLTLTDADKTNFGGGSLVLSDSTSTLYGGDGHDVLSIRFLGTAAGQFSYAAATREVKYAFTNPNGSVSVTTIGTIDANLNGNGTDLRVVFNNNATQAVLDALIDNLQFSNNDDSPTLMRLLTLRITDPSGASAQRVTQAGIEDTPDAPLFTSPAAFAIDEDQSVVGPVVAVDPDREAGAPQGITYSLVTGTGSTDNALFSVDAGTGTLRFISAPDYEGPHSPAYSLRVRASDSNGGIVEQVISVTVRNVNNEPVASNLQATASEDGPSILIQSGATDPTPGDVLTYSINVAGTHGLVTVEGPAFRYNPVGRFENMGAGSTFQDSFAYTVTDSAGHAVTRTVTVTVQGANDAPIATPNPFLFLGEAGATGTGNAFASGGLGAFDPDGDPISYSVGTSPRFGLFTLMANGQWTYLLDNANATVQALREYDYLDETIVVNVSDPNGGVTPSQLRFLIAGANDAPVVSQVQVALAPLVEAGYNIGGTATSSGTVAGSATDPEGDVLTWVAAAQQGQYGTFTIGSNGAWQYNLDNARADLLVQDQRVTESFVVAVRDSSGATATRTLRFDVQGSNDRALISGDTQSHVLEDQVLAAAGFLSITDPDAGQSSLVPRSAAVGSAGGVFNVAANGAWTYSIDNALTVVQSLRAGESIDDTLTVSSLDGTAQQVLTVTIHGADDAAVFTGTTGLEVQEGSFDANGNLTVGANVGIVDPDAGQAQVQPFSDQLGSNWLGRFSVTANGDWTWTSHANPWQLDALAQGQSITDRSGVMSLDGSFTFLEVTINGQNDAPVIFGGESTGQVVEPGGFPPEMPAPPTTASGSLIAWDVDSGDVLAWSGSAEGQYGSFTIDASGHWTYVVDAVKSDPLVMGESALDSFTATVSDGHGGTAAQAILVTVYGGNEPPAVLGATSTLEGTVQELPAPDGTLIVDWSNTSNYGDAVCTDAAGRILLVSDVEVFPGYTQKLLSRFNADGSLDTSYGSGGHSQFQWSMSTSEMQVDAQGRTVAVGYNAANYGSTAVDFAVTRVLADGSLDTSFGVDGVASIDIAGGYDYANAMFFRPGGKIQVVGTAGMPAGNGIALVVVQFREDGSLDEGFANGGKLFLPPSDYVKQLTMDAQGRYITWSVESNSQSYATEIHVERYLADGSPDASFGTQGATQVVVPSNSAYAMDLAVAPDGSIVLATTVWSNTASHTQVMLSRVNGDGSFDSSFGQGGFAMTDVWGAPHTLEVDAQGRILVAGQPATTIGTSMDFMVARYLADGTPDASFGNGGSTITDVSAAGLDDFVHHLFVNADGSLLLAGATMTSTYLADPALAKYTADGQLDTSFGVGIDPAVWGIIDAADPDAWPGGYQPLQYSATNAGVYGTFNLLSPNGGYWTYTLDNTRSATQALDEGETATDTITVSIRDGMGGVTYQDVVITVVGSFDPPAG